jgi:hypothetical protein
MKLKMDNDLMVEEFFDGTQLLGIVAPLKSYQFCWLVNQAMQVDFRINNDFEIQLDKKSRKYYFSVYEFAEPAGSMVHYLYSNQFDGEYLLPEFKNLDYLWLLKGDSLLPQALTDLQQTIRTLAAVQLVVELSAEKIKNKGHLIF